MLLFLLVFVYSFILLAQEIPLIDWKIPDSFSKENSDTDEIIWKEKILAAQGKQDILLNLCREFLKKNPDSSLRYQVNIIIKNILKKNLQLYCAESPWAMSCEQHRIVLTGANLSQLDFSIAKVSLSEMIEKKQNLELLPSKNEIIESWKIPIESEKHGFVKTIELKKLPPGIYKITAKDEDISSDLGLWVSDLGMVIKQTKDLLMVWTCHRDGTKIKEPVRLQFLYEDQKIGEAQTDNQGVWIGKFRQPIYPITIVACYQKEHWAIAKSSWYEYQAGFQQGYIALDRPEYQAGQTVHAQIILRNFDPQKQEYNYIPNSQINITFQDSQWRSLLSETVLLNELGAANFSFVLPQDAISGRYCLRIRGWCMVERYFQVQSLKDISSTSYKNDLIPLAENLKNSSSLSGIINQSISGIILPHQQWLVGNALNFSAETKQFTRLITYETDQILAYKFIEESKKMENFSQIILKNWIPGIKLVATWREFGYCNSEERYIPIENPDKYLNFPISIQSPPKNDFHQAGNLLTITIDNEISNQAKKIQVWATIFPKNYPNWNEDLQNFYYGERHYEIPTSDSQEWEFLSDRETISLKNIAAYKKYSLKNIALSNIFGTNKVYSQNLSQTNQLYWYSQIVDKFPHEIKWTLEENIIDWEGKIYFIDEYSRIGQHNFSISVK